MMRARHDSDSKDTRQINRNFQRLTRLPFEPPPSVAADGAFDMA